MGARTRKDPLDERLICKVVNEVSHLRKNGRNIIVLSTLVFDLNI
jgi:hypothetical protein